MAQGKETLIRYVKANDRAQGAADVGKNTTDDRNHIWVDVGMLRCEALWVGRLDCPCRVLKLANIWQKARADTGGGEERLEQTGQPR